MKKLKQQSLMLLIITAALCSNASGQKKEEAFVCKQEIFARLQPLPKLNYKCRPDAANDYDEAILKWPERIRAINDYMHRLEAFSSGNWWDDAVNDLNLCYFRGRVGELDEEEKERFRQGDYPLNLFGNDRIRLVLAADPCYQTGFNGSNAFLLYRQKGKVSVTQVLDRHFSRADNSVQLAFANLNGERVIEIATWTGGLNPYTTNHYFEIDKRTGKAVPKRIFKEGKRLTNKVTSVLILDDGTFPEGYAEMVIVKGNRLTPKFYTYRDAGGPGSITDASGRKLQRSIYKWNGKYYSKIR
jgi:hypothetical protein